MVAVAPMLNDADLEAWRRAGGVAASVRVRDTMSWPALTIAATTTVGRAAKIAAEQGMHHLLVARRGDLIGVLCTCDLRDAPEAAPVASRMTRRVIKVDVGAPLTLARELMEDYDVGCLPCLWLGAWGIVTLGDLVRSGVGERPTCVACGGSHHVRRHPRYAGLNHCLDCLSGSLGNDEVSRLYVDLGGGD